ncbi:unnamed protein product, partial [Rotaria socialis]
CFATDKRTLPEKHPYFRISYSNIGDVHRLVGDCEKALAFHRKALNIQENVKCNPLDCSTAYVSLWKTYRQTNDYSVALAHLSK